MPEEIVTAADANRYFSRILRTARAGGSVLITSHGKPVARLCPADAAPPVPASPAVEPPEPLMLGGGLEEMEAHWATLSPILGRGGAGRRGAA